jgi:hypothetical protein
MVNRLLSSLVVLGALGGGLETALSQDAEPQKREERVTHLAPYALTPFESEAKQGYFRYVDCWRISLDGKKRVDRWLIKEQEDCKEYHHVQTSIVDVNFIPAVREGSNTYVDVWRVNEEGSKEVLRYEQLEDRCVPLNTWTIEPYSSTSTSKK